MDKDFEYWDVDVRFGTNRMGEIMKALIRCRGVMVDSMLDDSEGWDNDGWRPVQIRIKLPLGKKDEFVKLAMLTSNDISEPPVVQL